MSEKLLHTLADTTEETGLSRSSLYRLMRSGELVSCEIAGRRLIPHQSLVDLIERSMAGSDS